MDGPFPIFKGPSISFKNKKGAIHKLQKRENVAYGWPFFRIWGPSISFKNTKKGPSISFKNAKMQLMDGPFPFLGAIHKLQKGAIHKLHFQKRAIHKLQKRENAAYGWPFSIFGGHP
jgi:hypothetical protein